MNSTSFFSSSTKMCAAFIILVGIVCIRSYASQQDGVMVLFSSPNATITLHEPVYVDFSIHNGLAESVDGDLGLNKKSRFAFKIIDPSGTAVQAPRLGDEGAGRIGRFSIEPGSTYKQRLLLGEWYQFTKPGTYKVEATVDDVIQTAKGDKVARDVAQTLSLTILPRNEERLKKVCQDLAERAVTAQTSIERSDAAFALSHVLDPVAVPYLRQVLTQSNQVRNIAIDGLDRIANRDAVDALISNLKTHGRETEALIVFALKEIKAKTQDQKVKDVIGATLEKKDKKN